MSDSIQTRRSGPRSARCTLLALGLVVTALPLSAQRTGERPVRERPAPPPVRPAPAPPVAPGAPSLEPVPIGGLRTRPFTGGAGGTTRPVTPVPPYRGRRVGTYPYGTASGVYPLAVADAPLRRAGVVVVQSPAAAAGQAEGRLWIPSGDRPRWRIDSTLTPVQAWRDIIVTDVVCDGAGVCLEREQQARAPWVAVCRCYMFADAWGRRWRVE